MSQPRLFAVVFMHQRRLRQWLVEHRGFYMCFLLAVFGVWMVTGVFVFAFFLMHAKRPRHVSDAFVVRISSDR